MTTTTGGPDEDLFKIAMTELNNQLRLMLENPDHRPHLAERHRRALVQFAENAIAPRRRRRVSANRVALERLTAHNIAGMIAIIDPPTQSSPFTHSELRQGYLAQRHYRELLLSRCNAVDAPASVSVPA
jgi:hypothetical protein